MKFKPIIFAVIALAALAGCKANSSTTNGSATNPPNAAGGGTVDPCSLITTSEATAALGTSVTNGVPHAYQNTKQCQWDAAQGPDGGSVAILVYICGQKSQWPSILAVSKQAPKFSNVQGLGDAAFTTGFDVHILKGDDMYQIGVSGPFQDQLSRATTVAKEALARV